DAPLPQPVPHAHAVGVALETGVGGGVGALAEVGLDGVAADVTVHGGTLRPGDAVDGPGVDVVGVVGEVRARVDVPVLGGHDVGVTVAVGVLVLTDEAGDLIAAVGGEGTAGAEVVLDVDDDEG